MHRPAVHGQQVVRQHLVPGRGQTFPRAIIPEPENATDAARIEEPPAATVAPHVEETHIVADAPPVTETLAVQPPVAAEAGPAPPAPTVSGEKNTLGAWKQVGSYADVADRSRSRRSPPQPTIKETTLLADRS